MEQLRGVLESRGVVVAPSVLLTFLGNEAVHQLPATLAAWTGSHAFAGMAATTKPALAGFSLKAAVWGAGLPALVVAVAASAVLWTRTPVPAPPPSPPLPKAPVPTVVVRKPLDTPFAPEAGIDMGTPTDSKLFTRLPAMPGSHHLNAGTLTVRRFGARRLGHARLLLLRLSETGRGRLHQRPRKSLFQKPLGCTTAA